MSSRLRRPLSIENLLPEDIVFDIVSRLPVKTIIRCTCVCKKWRNLVLDSHFVRLQLPRSPECILNCCNVQVTTPSGTIKLLEIEDKPDHMSYLLSHPFMSFHTAHLYSESSIIKAVGSVNGLICLWQPDDESDNTCICNPITREYMILPQTRYDVDYYVKYGFGVSVTGEYKVIQLRCSRNSFKIKVYTLGTHAWRSLSQEVPYDPFQPNLAHGLFYNHHVHWIVARANQLFSFKLDDDTFQLFPLPHSLQGNVLKVLGVLKGCLSLFSWSNSVATLWVMKEHGIKKSWHKELEIKDSIISAFPGWFPVSLIDGLNSRSILLYIEFRKGKYILLAYFLETNTIEETTIPPRLMTLITYRPSFLKLQNFQPARVYVY